MIGNSRGGNGRVPTIDHAEAEALISARLDVALDPRQEGIIQAHLASCASCRRFAAQMEAMQSELRELPRLPASPTVSRQVRERISQPQSILDRLAGLFGGRLGVAPLALTAALLIMVGGAYALLGDDPESGRLGPTVGAGTTVADDSTNTALSVTEAPTRTPVQPGEVIVNTPMPTAPNVRALEETPTPTEEPTETPAPTETAVPLEPTATDEPEPTATDQPEPTATETPTDTPNPTATDEPTSTQTPTEEPTATDEPTATETPTDEPTATETPEPTATDEPTEEPTATDVPTEEPTATVEPAEEATATTVPILPLDETPVDDVTEEPIDETAPPDDTDEATAEPDGTAQIEMVGPTDEAATDEADVGGETGEGGEPDPGDTDPAELPLDNTRKIVDLTSGGAPAGPLRVNTPVSMMVLSADSGGGSLQVVGVNDGAVYMDLGAAAYPIWSPLGMVLLYQDLNGGVPSTALYDSELGLRAIPNPAEDAIQADIPAGWIDSTAYYLRVTGDEVILYGYEINSDQTMEVWRSAGVALMGSRPIPTGDGFLIATTASWLLVTADGSEFNLGPADYGLAGEGFLNPQASLIAYPTGSDLAIASIESPGAPIGFIPYAGGPGSGFSWSPDGSFVVVTNGASLAIYDTVGTFVGSAESATGVVIAAPQWLADGVYYVELSPTPSLRRILVANIPGFG